MLMWQDGAKLIWWIMFKSHTRHTQVINMCITSQIYVLRLIHQSTAPTTITKNLKPI